MGEISAVGPISPLNDTNSEAMLGNTRVESISEAVALAGEVANEGSYQSFPDIGA